MINESRWFSITLVLCLLAMNSKAAYSQKTAALLNDKIGDSDPCCVSTVSAALAGAGYSVISLDAASLSDPNRFNRKTCDTLIIPNSPQFPASAKSNLDDFVKRGGSLVMLGGQPFSDCLVQYKDNWIRPHIYEYQGRLLSKSEIIEQVVRENLDRKQVVLSFDDSGIEKALHLPRYHTSTSKLETVDGIAAKAVLIDIKNMAPSAWDLFEFPLDSRIPSKADVICFWAKGDLSTPKVSFEVTEKDGTRWITTVDITTQWKFYAKTAQDFHFQETTAKKRGGPGDKLNIPRIKSIMLGLSAHSHIETGDHKIWFDEISAVAAGIPDLNPVAPTPDIPYFNDYEQTLLKKIHTLSVDAKTGISIEPFAASALNSCHVQGFTVPGKSRFFPLLVAADARGRIVGNAAGIVINYGGPFADSAWVSFGITSPEFYRGKEFSSLLVQVMQELDKGKLKKQALDENAAYSRMDAKFGPFNYGLGTQAFSAQYQFTDASLLLESAIVTSEMGSNAFKCEVTSRASDIYKLPKDSRIKSMRDLLEKDDSYRKVLRMPFDYYLFWAYAFCGPHVCWYDGLSKKQKNAQYKEMYELTKYLLTDFNDTGKTFYLGHWEGDWMLIKSTDTSRDPNPTAIQGMIDWLNIRQEAIDDAKRDTQHKNVEVYHYTEVCLVQKAIQGKPTLTSHVLPKTNVDYVSYSSYDSADRTLGEPNMVIALNKALEYIEKQLPRKEGFTGKRIWIGEYGFPLIYLKDPGQQDNLTRLWTHEALKWGCPFALYWQLYCNTGDNARGDNFGFWLINNKNKKQPAYITHYEYLRKSREFVYEFRLKNGRNPSRDEYMLAALPWLEPN